MKKRLSSIVTVSAFALAAIATPAAYAATTANSQLTQEIQAGVLSTDILDAAGASVASPVFAMGSVSTSTSEQTSTGTFGEDDRRVSVDNPGAANSGFTLALNATVPGTGAWTSGANSYAYNGATSTDGQLTVDPSTGAVTALVGAGTGVSTGAGGTFTGTSAVTIMSASAVADDIWNGYITGIGLSQSIPAGQAAGSYTLDMTQTVTAL